MPSTPTSSGVVPLGGLRAGVRARVVSVEADADLRRRLGELGVLPGAVVAVVRRSPFGCPLEFETAGARYAVRRETADLVMVTPETA
jgi:Fe2+ transport system protein FeoA